MVDDDPQTLRYVRDALGEAGYTAIVAAAPGEMPRLVRTGEPRLALLDLPLPGTNGIDLMESVPELTGLLVTSAYGRDETVAKACPAQPYGALQRDNESGAGWR